MEVTDFLNRIVVFAPHSDDDILCCGGTIIKKLKNKFDVSIVYMTDGSNALSNIGVHTDPSPGELKQIRRKEAIRGANLLGVKTENLHFLDNEDTKLHYNPDIVNKIHDILKSIEPQEIYLPSIKDTHSDHKNTYLIVMESLRTIEQKSNIYLYIACPKYANLDYINKWLYRIFDKRYIENDISEFLPQKYFSLLQHKSQITVINSKQRRPVLSPQTLKRLLSNTEYFFYI